MAAYTFQASGQSLCRSWVEAVRNAQVRGAGGDGGPAGTQRLSDASPFPEPAAAAAAAPAPGGGAGGGGGGWRERRLGRQLAHHPAPQQHQPGLAAVVGSGRGTPSARPRPGAAPSSPSCPRSPSDGSTETLAVVAADGSDELSSPDWDAGPFGSTSDSSSAGTGASSAGTPAPEPPAGALPVPSPGGCRSASIDSAYGTLSPASLRDFGPPAAAAAAAAEERREPPPAPRPPSPRLRRRRPVQLLPGPARVLKSKSEASLPQLLPAGPPAPLSQSRSLSDLCARSPRTGRAAGPPAAPGSSGSSASELSEPEEPGESPAPLPGQPGRAPPPAARRTLSAPPPPRPRTLTLAQLHRIRTTLLLNSTLTAS